MDLGISHQASRESSESLDGLGYDSIPALLRSWANQTPDALALLAPGQASLTYQQLYAQVVDVNRFLNARGISRGDRVALALPNGVDAAVAVLAVAASATCAPLNPSYRTNEFDFYLADLHAKAVIVQSGIDSPVRVVAAERGIPVLEIQSTNPPTGIITLQGGTEAQLAEPGFALPDDIALTLHTSGTTSRPKLVPLTQRNVCRSAQNIVASLRLTDTDRGLNVMPLFHIHGLIGILLSSLTAGASLVCLPEFSPPAFFLAMRDFRATWYSAVPTIHHAIVAEANVDPTEIQQRRLRFVRSSSAPLPRPVLRGLERAFAAPVIEAYGMTEAAHQISSNPLPPLPSKPGSVGIAAGPEIAVLDETGNVLAPGLTGEVAIRGSNVFAGYEGAPEANALAFTNGWLRTGDQGFLDSDGYLFLTGRLKELINRGGEKISPREVDDALLSHPGIAQAVTFALPHPTLGEEVAAAVVLSPGDTTTERELQEFVSHRLADFKVPRRILMLDQLPKGATGKLVRVGLAETLGLTLPFPDMHGTSNGNTLEPTPSQKLVADVWTQVLGHEPDGLDDNFFLAGGDSLSSLRLTSRLREARRVEISLRIVFESPTVRELADRLDVIGTEPSGQPSVSQLWPQSGTGEPILSIEQRRLWLLHQREIESGLHNVPVAMRLLGRLSIPSLDVCLGLLAQRHEILRTTFPTRDWNPVSVIHLNMQLNLTVSDVSNLPAADAEIEIQGLLQQEARRPFDLATGPLLRAHLVRLATEDHVLLVTTHKIVADEWSSQLLFQELLEHYSEIQQGVSPPGPAQALTYFDYANWQRASLDGNRRENLLSYWSTQLADMPQPLQLPFDRGHSTRSSNATNRLTFSLPADLRNDLQVLGRAEGATLFMTLLAALKTLLFRYTGQDDLIVGTQVAGRIRPEFEDLIGCFSNTLLLRTGLGGNPSFREVLRRVRNVALDGYAHQELPFALLVEALTADQRALDSLRVPIMLRWQEPLSFVGLPELALSSVDVTLGVSPVDLALTFRDQPDGPEGWLEYSTDLFDDGQIQHMVNHYQTLLQGVVTNPDQPIDTLPLLTATERQQLLVDWNATAAPLPEQTVTELFAAQVERTPDAMALVAGEQQLTYRQLNQRANQLAHHLQDLGVAPEVCVGLCLERSPELLIGILAILKAGGVYVPLDPGYPAQRLAFMLDEINAPVLLTRQHLTDLLPPGNHQLVCLDTDWPAIAQHPTSAPPCLATPDNLAYILYTSGSTGRPKGVMIEHRGLLNYLNYVQSTFGLNSKDVTLQLPRISFDASVRDLLGPLVSGACIVLISQDDSRDPATLLSTIRARRVTCLLAIIPRMLRQLSEFAYHSGMFGDTVRLILVGGEALQLADCLHVPDVLNPKVLLVNQYGPTEITMTATYHPVATPVNAQDIALIGRPIQNVEAYVLDPQFQPLPIGVPGELHIGGVGVARGYLNRPDLTAERFLPNPFSDDPSDRLYKTGDLVRYRADGNLEFLGRMDYQVKLRGYRIELGEIESVLAQHPAVRGAAVLLREDQPGEPRLVAYVVPQSEVEYTASALRQHLSARLPDYMLPAAFVPLTALPLSPNGKLDRHALPAPDRPQSEVALVPPRTPTEATLATIWASLLGFEPIGIHDNFFDLGGHSLMATQLALRINGAFQVELPLRTIFLSPTIAELAAAILELQLNQLTDEELVKLLNLDPLGDNVDRLSVESL